MFSCDTDRNNYKLTVPLKMAYLMSFNIVNRTVVEISNASTSNSNVNWLCFLPTEDLG